MFKKIMLLAGALCALNAGSCAMAADFSGHNVGVVYFTLLHNRLEGNPDTQRGKQYGDAELLARAVAQQTGADLIEINTVDKYPDNYDDTVDQAREEQRAGYKPPLVSIPDLSSYDVLFIGFPNWWGSYPMAFATLFESQSFEGKAIIPFCTHGGSRLGRAPADMRNAMPGARIYDGFEIRGNGLTEDAAQKKVADFLSSFAL